MQGVRNLDDVEVGEGALHQNLVHFLSHQSSSLKRNILVDVLHTVFRTGARKVFGLAHSPVDELAPVLPGFVLVDDPQVLADELRVQSDHLEELKPKLENLGAHHINVVDQLVAQLKRVARARPADRKVHQTRFHVERIFSLETRLLD